MRLHRGMLLDQGPALEVAILFGLEEDGAIGRSIGVGRSEVKFDPFYFYIVLIFAGTDELVFLGCTEPEGLFFHGGAGLWISVDWLEGFAGEKVF